MAVIWTPSSLPSTDAANSNQSNRVLCSTLSNVIGGAAQVRVTLIGAQGGGTLVLSNVSIGVSAGTGFGDITGSFNSATFQEVTFVTNGAGAPAHGVTLTGTGTVVSDWINLTFGSSDNLVVVLDYGGSSTACYHSTTNSTEFICHAPPEYNVAVPGGTSNNGAFVFNVTQIETQAIAATVTLMGAICL